MSDEFGRPVSRNEAIIQNILGAGNVLEDPESRIEQILQFSTIEEEEHPRMRGGDPALRRGYGGSEREGQ